MSHVLVVEDSKDSRDLLAFYLKRQGHTVSTAADGQAGLGKLLSDRVDVVVLDMHMPGMDGIELLEVMRAYLRFKTQTIPA